MSELKPCPFCGGEAEADTMQGFRAMASGRLENAAAIYCRDCSAQMSFCYSDEPDIPREDVMANLVVAWNTRADLSDALLREAMEALGKLHHAVCGETGFAHCVRLDSGMAYPWPALDDADENARATLAKLRSHMGGNHE